METEHDLKIEANKETLKFAIALMTTVVIGVTALWLIMAIGVLATAPSEEEKKAWKENRAKRIESIRKDGEKAKANGITPTANPYIQYTNEAREWLDAYMDAGDPTRNFKASEVNWLTPDDEVKGK